MKIWKRKILLILAFSLFFIISPVLVFYAMGYRYDFENKAFRQIGMIILESKPDNANIFINGNFESTTPYRIKNLLPNEYSINIKKEGFNSWKKILSVGSKKVTWASNIVLFFKNPKKNNLTDLILNNFKISPNHKKIVTSSTHEDSFGIWILDIESKQSKKIFPNNNLDYSSSPISKKELKNIQYSKFLWSENNNKIIISLKNELENYIIIDTEKNSKPVYINNSYDLKVKKIQWKSNEEIYLLDKSGNLHQINLNSKYTPKILQKNIVNFEFNKENSNIVYVSKEDNNYKLNLLSNENTKNILNLPNNEEFEIQFGKKNSLTLLLKNKKELLLINTGNNEPKVIGSNTNYSQWSNDKNKILFSTNNEIWFYPLKKESEKEETTSNTYNYNEANLLTRYSEEIKNATWYPNEEYITILLENSIKIIELDGRDKRNCQELKNDLLPKDHFIEFDKKGELIYLIDNKNILQEIKISEF